jgi:caffeoyl-CoA O-methyltransferase
MPEQPMKIKRRTFLGTAPLLTAAFSLPLEASEESKKVAPEVEKVLQELEATQAHFYNVPRKDGEFLNLLTKLTRAKRILEIGTANGYSAIWFALALQETDGKLTTIEIKPDLVKMAKSNLKRVGLDSRVTFLEGDAHDIVTRVDGPFDLIFIDAELGGKMDYFRKLYPQKLPPGGLLVCHNVIRYRSAMEDYLQFIQAHEDFDTVILSLTMDDGFSVSLRKRPA